MQRSMMVFEASIKTEATRKYYRYYLNKFLEFAKLKDYDALLQLKDSYLQEMLEDYLFYLKKRISPNSLTPRFSALELFFIMNDKNLNFKKIRKMFPARQKRSGKEAWPTEDIQKMLRYTKDPRNRALLLFLSSTGARIGAIPDLRIKHLSDMPSDCKAVLFYQDSEEEYFGFLTPEANKALTEYLEKRKRDGENLSLESPVFRIKYKLGISPAKPTTLQALTHIIRRVVREANPLREKTGYRFQIQQNHGFRKRFNTILKNNDQTNLPLAEKLMGHKGVIQLDGYYHAPTKQVLFNEFVKHIKNLTIDESERQKIIIKSQQEELGEKEQLKLELDKVKGEYLRMKDVFDILDNPLMKEGFKQFLTERMTLINNAASYSKTVSDVGEEAIKHLEKKGNITRTKGHSKDTLGL